MDRFEDFNQLKEIFNKQYKEIYNKIEKIIRGDDLGKESWINKQII